MEKKNIAWVIKQYFESTPKKDTQHLFEKWAINSKDKSEKETALADLWESLPAKADSDTIDDLEKLHQRIDHVIKPNRKQFTLRLFARVAAAVLIPILCIFTTYTITKKAQHDVQLEECFVGNGERKFVELPDGSQVWVNSGSLLIYPETFSGDTRTVYLNGEANFKVAKDQTKRFIVNTGQLSVDALGTTFNVQAYLDMQKTTASLEEGAIKIETKGNSPQSIVIAPNEQVIYDHKKNDLTMKVVDAKRVSMWKDGYLAFQGATTEDIFHAIEKRYDVVIQYDAGKYVGRTFTVRFHPDDTLDDTLLILKEIIRDFNYKIKDRSIYIN